MKQFLNKALLGLAGLGLAASGIVSCSDNGLELYEVGAPADLQERIDAAAKTDDTGNDDQEEPGLLVDLTKYADDFEFVGNAKLIGDIILIDGTGGGKNGNYVTTKNPGWLEGKIELKDVVTVSFDARPTVNSTDWNYTFGIGYSNDGWNYVDGTIGFIQRMGDPYQAVFPGDFWTSENTMGGSATENPYNYFSGLDESNCNKWYHFDYVYSPDEFAIYVNGVKQVAHKSDAMTAITADGIQNVISNLYKGDIHIGCGIDPANENFGGYIANFRIHDEIYVKKSGFFNGEIPDNKPKSIIVKDAPKAVEINSTDFLKDAKLFIKWDNEAEEELKAENFVISTTAPMDEDGKLNTLGTYTVTVSYALTKNGNATNPVATAYIIEVTAEISDIKVETVDMASFLFAPGTTEIKKADIDVASYIKAVKGITGSSDIKIPASEYKAEVTAIPTTIAEGEKIEVTVTYKNITTKFEIALKQIQFNIKVNGTDLSVAPKFNGNSTLDGDRIIISGDRLANNSVVFGDVLKDKITFTNAVTVSFDAKFAGNTTDWNYLFALGSHGDENGFHYVCATVGFISSIGDPWSPMYPGGNWAEGNLLGGNNLTGTEEINPYNYFLLPDNENIWHHFDYVYTATGAEIWMDGKKATNWGHDGNAFAGALNYLTTNLRWGSNINGTEGAAGTYTNISIRNTEYHQEGACTVTD